MATPLEKYREYRDQDKHECGLILGRMNALLTSQSLFLAASAVLFSNFRQDGIDKQRMLVLPIAIVALVAAASAGVAISIGCSVLRAWHRHGMDIIRNPANLAPNANSIDDCFMPGRANQPDWRHWVSIDVFGHLLPVLFSGFWVLVIVWLTRQ